MNRLVAVIMVSSTLLATPPVLAADCDEDTAADFNSRIQANFTIMESGDPQNAALREKIEALQQQFSEAGELHSEALDNHDQAGLNEACGRYEDILKEQASLPE